MKSFIATVSGLLVAFSINAADVSMNVPGAEAVASRSVLTFIAKDPPGQRAQAGEIPTAV